MIITYSHLFEMKNCPAGIRGSGSRVLETRITSKCEVNWNLELVEKEHISFSSDVWLIYSGGLINDFIWNT